MCSNAGSVFSTLKRTNVDDSSCSAHTKRMLHHRRCSAFAAAALLLFTRTAALSAQTTIPCPVHTLSPRSDAFAQEMGTLT